MEFETLTATTVSELSNKQLIDACKHFNIACGAINKTSRELFEKKLVAALTSSANGHGPVQVVEEVEEVYVENPSTPLFVNEFENSKNLFETEEANVYNDTPYPVIRSSKITKRITTESSPRSYRRENYEGEGGENCDGEESVRILTEAERAERRARLFSKAVHQEPPVFVEEKKSIGSTILKLTCLALFLLFAYFFYIEHMKRLQEENNDEL
uniref:LEM domain-containing protein n=1 Tax=Strongyloides venezuelensis TaxID=75913 RepID=A0A0K0G0Y8_STRVS